MLALLRTRRWIGFTALVIGTIIAFGLLSAWQWSRAEQRREERLSLQAALASTPTPLASVDLSTGLAPADEWRPVTVTGRFDTDLQAVVRKRPLEAVNGFWVMTVLQPPDGPAVWVNRGWMAAGIDALATPAIPAPPPGEVTVTGYLRAFEPADGTENEGLPAGQIAAPAAALLPATDSVPGYVQLHTSDPAQEGLVAVPLPTVDEGRNVSYAIQWILFAAIAMTGWYVVLRREAREDRAGDAGSPDVPEPVEPMTKEG